MEYTFWRFCAMPEKPITVMVRMQKMDLVIGKVCGVDPERRPPLQSKEIEHEIFVLNGGIGGRPRFFNSDYVEVVSVKRPKVQWGSIFF